MCHWISKKDVYRIFQLLGIIFLLLGGTFLFFGYKNQGKNYLEKQIQDNGDSLNQANKYYDFDLRYHLPGVFLVMGFSFVLVGVLAFFYEGNLCIRIAFGILISIMFINFFLATLTAEGMEYVHLEAKKDPKYCQNQEFFQVLDNYYKFSQQNLCSEKCECLIKDEDIFAKTEFLKDLSYSDKEGSINVMQCENEEYVDFIEEFESEFSKMIESEENSKVNNIHQGGFNSTSVFIGLESTLDCAGFCSKSPYYVFTDVNRGTPVGKKGCFQELSHFSGQYSYPLLFFFSFVLMLAFFSFLLMCALCCCSKEGYGFDNSMMVQYQQLSQQQQQQPQQQQEEEQQGNQLMEEQQQQQQQQNVQY